MSIAIDMPPKSTQRPQLRLQQLVSQGLPVGAFTYSQGLEWAVEENWVNDAESLGRWLQSLMHTSIRFLEVPTYQKLRNAVDADDAGVFNQWSSYLYANRETAELRAEEKHRARAFAKLLPALSLQTEGPWAQAISKSQLAGFAYATSFWQIDPIEAVQSYLWSWLENNVMAGVRLIPLGQTQGQQLIFSLSEQIPAIVQKGFSLNDDDIAGSSVAQAVASSMHETQYTRLYRS
ncbi:MAG: urease accessory UreF family protein [Pseudomonadota bacterium]